VKNLNVLSKVLLLLIIGLLVGSYWYLITDNIRLQGELDKLSDGLDQNIVDVSILCDKTLTLQDNMTTMKKRIDKLNSMLYNANKRIDILRSTVECQQSQILILRKEFK
jgi:hypothetical protein